LREKYCWLVADKPSEQGEFGGLNLVLGLNNKLQKITRSGTTLLNSGYHGEVNHGVGFHACFCRIHNFGVRSFRRKNTVDPRVKMKTSFWDFDSTPDP
jgi:hypothetical protein